MCLKNLIKKTLKNLAFHFDLPKASLNQINRNLRALLINLNKTKLINGYYIN